MDNSSNDSSTKDDMKGLTDLSDVLEGKYHCLFRILTWAPVLFVLMLVSWSYYAFVVQLCLYTIKEYWLQVFGLVFYHFFLTLFLWAYAQAIFTKSGPIPSKFSIPKDILKEAENETLAKQAVRDFVKSSRLFVHMRTLNGEFRFCPKCQIIKPDRAHHCSVCRACILKMDHHCPWINNCVSFRNQKFFVQFVGYAGLYCGFIFLMTVRYFIEFFWKEVWTGVEIGRTHVIYMSVLSPVFSIVLCAHFGFLLVLVCKNFTTLENFRTPHFRHGKDSSYFNRGLYNNFIEVFGDRKLYWFLPLFTTMVDGITYRTNKTCTDSGYSLNSLELNESSPASSSDDDFIGVKIESREINNNL